MERETPLPSHTRLSRKWVTWFAQWRLPRAAWVYVLAAAILLVVSQLLWRWHSWPVREILDGERPVAGASV